MQIQIKQIKNLMPKIIVVVHQNILTFCAILLAFSCHSACEHWPNRPVCQWGRQWRRPRPPTIFSRATKFCYRAPVCPNHKWQIVPLNRSIGVAPMPTAHCTMRICLRCVRSARPVSIWANGLPVVFATLLSANRADVWYMMRQPLPNHQNTIDWADSHRRRTTRS